MVVGVLARQRWPAGHLVLLGALFLPESLATARVTREALRFSFCGQHGVAHPSRWSSRLAGVRPKAAGAAVGEGEAARTERKRSIFASTGASRRRFITSGFYAATAGTAGWAGRRRAWAEEDPGADSFFTYTSKDTGFTVSVPSAFKLANKLVRTHKDEVFFKSTTRKKYSFGVTVDPVTISKLSDFGTISQVAENIIRVEKEKEGVIFAEMRGSSKIELSGRECFAFDYVANSTRGNIHYLANLVVDAEKNLHSITVQSKQDEFDEVKGEMEKVLASYQLRP